MFAFGQVRIYFISFSVFFSPTNCRTINSLYQQINGRENEKKRSRIWKANIPLQIIIIIFRLPRLKALNEKKRTMWAKKCVWSETERERERPRIKAIHSRPQRMTNIKWLCTEIWMRGRSYNKSMLITSSARYKHFSSFRIYFLFTRIYPSSCVSSAIITRTHTSFILFIPSLFYQTT